MTTTARYDHIYSPSGQDMDLAKSVAPVISKILGEHRQSPETGQVNQ